MSFILRASLLVTIFAAAAVPGTAFAQCPETRASRPMLIAGGGYDVPLRESGSVGLLIPIWDLEYGDPGCSTPAYRGVLVGAGAGSGGHRFSVGLARQVKEKGQPLLFGQDLLVSVLRTRTSPSVADADSTYLSVEGGLTFVSMRLGLGVARRLTPEGQKRTIFIRSFGVQVGW